VLSWGEQAAALVRQKAPSWRTIFAPPLVWYRATTVPVLPHVSPAPLKYHEPDTMPQ
jgi:hypothetical protein